MAVALLMDVAFVVCVSAIETRRAGFQENGNSVENNAVLVKEIESLQTRVQDLETYKEENYDMIRKLQTNCGTADHSEYSTHATTILPDMTSHVVHPKHPPIVPLSVSVEKVKNKNTFVLEYISDTEPKVNWSMSYFYSNFDAMNIFPEFNSSYNGSHGITSVTTKHEGMTVYLFHPSLLWFVEVSLTAEKPTPNKLILTPVKLIIEQHDNAIVFDEGQDVSATLNVSNPDEEFGSMSIRTSFVTEKRNGNDNTSHGVTYNFDDSTYVTTGNGRPPLLVSERERYLHDQRVTYRVNPDKTDNEGILVISVIYDNPEHSSPVTEVMITRLISVHQSDHEEAFERGYVNFVSDVVDSANVYCQIGRTCFILCNAIGNGVTNITLWKNNRQIEIRSTETKLRYLFMKTFFLQYVTGSDGGAYVCKAATDVDTFANRPINVVVTFASSEHNFSQSET